MSKLYTLCCTSHEPLEGLGTPRLGKLEGPDDAMRASCLKQKTMSSNETRAKTCASCALRFTMLSELQKPRPLLLRLQQACSSQRLSFAAASHRLSDVPGPENAAVGRCKNPCRLPSKVCFFFLSCVSGIPKPNSEPPEAAR